MKINNKILKKIVGWFDLKLIEKNYVKNNRLLFEKSPLNIDLIFNFLFSNKYIKTLIQIGANDGERFDVLNKYIKKYKTKSLLVEPIKKNFEELQNNYKSYENIIFENSAISVNNEISELYKVKDNYLNIYDEHIKGITSFDISHLIKHDVKKGHITKEKINSISIKSLIEKYSFNETELIYTDAEGYDGKILIDFLNNLSLRPFLVFEYIHIKSTTFNELLNLLNAKKFFYFALNENIICIPEEKKSFIFQSNL